MVVLISGDAGGKGIPNGGNAENAGGDNDNNGDLTVTFERKH